MPTHGTRHCYQSGCRLPECMEAAAAYQRNLRTRQRPTSRPCHKCGQPCPVNRGKPVCLACRNIDRPGHLPAACWCQEAIVYVPIAEVRACRTRSCGQPTSRAA